MSSVSHDTTDEFLTPKEFAKRKQLCAATARGIFNSLEHDPGAIERTGIRTKRYPKGKLLRMRMSYFLEHYSSLTPSTQPKQSTLRN